jgi:hypothetical protein
MYSYVAMKLGAQCRRKGKKMGKRREGRRGTTREGGDSRSRGVLLMDKMMHQLEKWWGKALL